MTALLIWFSCHTSAVAGAWPREEGQFFISAGGNFLLSDGARLPVHYDPTLYVEYGWDGHITLGADVHTADVGRIIAGFVFVNVPIGDPDADNKFAAQLGLGTRLQMGQPTEYQIRAGASWGRGLTNGWLAADAYTTIGTRDRTLRPKLDLTWGHHWSESWTTSLQLQSGQGSSGDYYVKIVPSVIYSLRPDIQIQVGAVQALTGDKGAGLKVETWFRF